MLGINYVVLCDNEEKKYNENHCIFFVSSCHLFTFVYIQREWKGNASKEKKREKEEGEKINNNTEKFSPILPIIPHVLLYSKQVYGVMVAIL